MGARRRNFSCPKRFFSWGLDIPRRNWDFEKRLMNSVRRLFSSELLLFFILGEVSPGSALMPRAGVRGTVFRARFMGLRSPVGAVRLLDMSLCCCSDGTIMNTNHVFRAVGK